MASHIIGISGRKRSGKDTFAEQLVKEHGFTRIAFADPLKAVARELDPVVDVHQATPYVVQRIRLSDVLGPDDDWETAKELPEVRRLLQALGVAVREHIDSEVWVDAALVKAAAVPGPVVITDVRFPNEAERVRWDGGKVVRVNRPGLPQTDLHISETALDDLVADYVVGNGGTVADLHESADEVARLVLG